MKRENSCGRCQIDVWKNPVQSSHFAVDSGLLIAVRLFGSTFLDAKAGQKENASMITIQIVPKRRVDAYKLLRDKVTHEAKTWYWGNKAKTRLRHVNLAGGYIEVGSADNILVVELHPRDDGDLFFLAEKFVGRLTAWFADQIVAINMQFIDEEGKGRKK